MIQRVIQVLRMGVLDKRISFFYFLYCKLIVQQTVVYAQQLGNQMSIHMEKRVGGSKSQAKVKNKSNQGLLLSGEFLNQSQDSEQRIVQDNLQSENTRVYENEQAVEHKPTKKQAAVNNYFGRGGGAGTWEEVYLRQNHKNYKEIAAILALRKQGIQQPIEQTNISIKTSEKHRDSPVQFETESKQIVISSTFPQEQKYIIPQKVNDDKNDPLTDRPNFDIKNADIVVQVKSQSSSGNVFQSLQKQINRKLQTESVSDESENIFDTYKKIHESEGSNQSDEGNIFDIAQRKKVEDSEGIKSSYGGQRNSLNQLLQNSGLYKDYLKRKGLKKLISLNIPELQGYGKAQFQQKLNGMYFKPQRIEFKKLSDEPYGESQYTGQQYLLKVNQQRTQFYYRDLRSQQINNYNHLRCPFISFQCDLKISPHTEYDHFNQRFYLFSNAQQKIIVISQLSMEVLCKVSVQKKVMNPNIHFFQINGRNFLILLGGYIKIEKQVAQGNKYIQIFQVTKWYFNLKSRLIKLIIGRIHPIVLMSKQRHQNKLFVLGGNTIAKVDSKGNLSYSYQKSINQSTNMTGISINCKEIPQLFDLEEHTNIVNLSIKLSQPHCLYSGITIFLNNNIFLILPKSTALFQVKISQRQININQAKTSTFLGKVQKNQKRQLHLKIQRQNLISYFIDDGGYFHITSHESSKNKRCCCNIY